MSVAVKNAANMLKYDVSISIWANNILSGKLNINKADF